ncbi:MAG: hypothetical protein NTZ09_02030 [Candidatus Hydrogenedentes bacterium]|nr:hypothetical protein [Candidatus Hydrogenedentota bacterium]
MVWLKRKQTLHDLDIRLPLSEIKKRAKILVIDDEPASFPAARLAEEGYHIETWETVKSLSKLEDGAFDIIILDYMGVADEEVSQKAGLGILEHLKKVNPAQLIIAFSAHSFDASSSNFWRLADDNLGKPIDVVKCKEVIDQLLVDKFTISHYWGTLASVLKSNGATAKDISRLEGKIVESLARRETADVIEYCDELCRKLGIGVRIAVIISQIFGFFQGPTKP